MEQFTKAEIQGKVLELQHENETLKKENEQIKKQLNIQNGIYYG